MTLKATTRVTYIQNIMSGSLIRAEHGVIIKRHCVKIQVDYADLYR